VVAPWGNGHEALGVSEESLVAVACEGRRSNVDGRLSMLELAAVLIELGAESAINLDGGVSTTRAYVAALDRVAGWRSDGADIVLLDEDDSELLRFGAATPVGEWVATAIQTGTALASPLPGTEITATFSADGSLSGSVGCNTYRTSYTTDRGGIEIATPAATKKACASPDGVREQEAAYLASLPTAARYRLDGGSLALLSADGTYVASYSAAAKP
jgi:heat shock protein HslJ